MKKLNKSQEYAVLYLMTQGKTEQDIVHELKISQESLKAFVEKNNKAQKKSESKIKTTTSPAKLTSKDLMINTTSVKGTKSVSIMTKEASQVNDDFRKNIGPVESRITKNAIHRPNG